VCNALKMIHDHIPNALQTADGDRFVDFVDFVDSSYVQWRVSERNARRDPGAKGDLCLIFACPGMVRRVWDYPANWRTLSPAALLALSWGR
jgi:hypothetical protein